MTWETQDEEMLPEFEARSLAEEWHNPFRWEVQGMAKVRVGLFVICHVYEAFKSEKKTNQAAGDLILDGDKIWDVL